MGMMFSPTYARLDLLSQAEVDRQTASKALLCTSSLGRRIQHCLPTKSSLELGKGYVCLAASH